MIKRLFTLLTATAFLAACETASTTTGDVTSSAQSSSTNAATTASSSSSSSSAASSSSSGDSASANVKSEFAKVGTTVLFEFDSAQLTDYAQRVLDRQAAFMKARPETRVIIGGHADERGTREYNLALGERRANAVARYLVIQGVNRSQIETVSYGEERPLSLARNDSGWSRNRRVELIYQ